MDLKIKKILERLIKEDLSVSTMESCTSGLLCSSLTDVEGASKVIKGGYITYTNNQKINVGVSDEIIKQYGVYSIECSVDMAKKALSLTNSDISIGVTGSLGNIDPNNKDSVAGEIYYTIMIKDKVYSKKISLKDKKQFLTKVCVIPPPTLCLEEGELRIL